MGSSVSSMPRNRVFRFLSWNVRGLNDPSKCSTIKAFIRNSKCCVVCFQETKLATVTDAKLRSFCGNHLRDFRALDANGTKGGILTAWNSALFDCIHWWATSYSLNVTLKRKADGIEFLISNIYGPTCAALKDSFFHELTSIGEQAPAVWALLGDFNTLLALQDKNGTPSNISEILLFRSAVNNLGLLDLPLSNRSFTWTNGRRIPTLERLDRAFISQGWISHFPNSSWRALPRPRSDHTPLVLTAFSFIPSTSLFRFESYWLRYPTLADLISTAWSSPTPATNLLDPLKRFNEKLTLVQRTLQSWSAGLSSGIKKQGDLCLYWMEWLDKAEEFRRLNELECGLRPMLKERYEELAFQDEIKWRQRSRVLWLQAGDANTSFFHRKANCRRGSNRISAISDGTSTLTAHADIAAHLFTSFSSQFGSTPLVSPQINLKVLYGRNPAPLSQLLVPFTVEEVKSAIFASAPEKAPGPDGFPGIFYQRFWLTLKADILQVFEAFHSGSADLSVLNTSWICAIPKKAGPLTVRSLRPISLVHSLSKLISKVLATRLQSLINQLINPHQSAFIKGRHLLDNFLCAHFLVHHLHATKTPAAVLKLDFERAFDHVNWDFLKDVLAARGFGNKWISWTSLLLDSASATVLLNGVPGKPFVFRRGLRQGDPLSPLLFILCIDVLFRMMQRAIDEELLPTVDISGSGIHTLQFADDVLIFFDGSLKSAATIKMILDAFSESSGLSINYGKSCTIPINLSQEQSSLLANWFKCPSQDFPLKYLGLPLTPRRLRKSDYMPILEKLDSRLAGWKNLTLSRGGRLVLLNSVLTGIPSFFCSAFRLPVWVSKYIDKIRRGFFWKGEKLKGGFHCLMKWGIVCRPRRLGGVGIRDLIAANSALLMKSLWSFFSTPLVPWAQFIWNKHYRLRPPAPSGKHPAGSSPIWKDMMKLSAPFFASVCFELGPGKIANFWSARWNGEFALKSCFPNLFTVSAATNASVSSWLHRFASPPWAAFPMPLTSAQNNEFRLLTEAIGSTELSNNRDVIIWRWTDKGLFTTRSAYLFLMDAGIKDGKNTFLWMSKTPLRVKLFLWLAAHNCLLTADNLAKRGWIGPSVCPFCSQSSENLEHILFDCTYALSMWSSFFDGNNTANRGRLAPSGNLTARWQKLRSIGPASSPRERTFIDIAFAASVWELWKERNARIFTNRQASVEILKGRVRATANLWAMMIK